MTDELITNGVEHWLNYGMPLWETTTRAFASDLETGTRFRVILAESGSGIIQGDTWRCGIIAPTLLCLNELEQVRITHSLDLRTRAFFFHPAIINGAFNFENVRSGVGLNLTSGQDRFWLRPFIDHNETFHGVLNIGPTSARRLVCLFDLITEQLVGQPDGTWPCRTRSYFLELLFFIERIYSAPDKAAALPPASSTPDVDNILLYLYSHYQSKLTLSQLARTFHSNRTTITRDFHATTGMPIMSYLNHLRIQVASVMLRDTQLNVNEIVRRVGFRDNTHFVRTFRKQNGCTPTEYRSKYCWM